MVGIILLTLASSLLLNVVLFLIAYRYKSDKLTDISYSLSFLSIAIIGLVSAPKREGLQVLLFMLVAIWAVRTGGFLLARVLRVGKDRRFDGMREDFVKFGKFWVGQAVTAWVLMLPAVMAMQRGGKIGALAAIGAVIWCIGWVVEAAADYQKQAFKQDPANKGRWIDSGLWHYSRHPNYFGEITVWVGVYLASFSALTGFGRVIGLLSPALIAFVLLRISGVPILERQADEKWGDQKAYQQYKHHTRLLVPLPRSS